MEHLPEFPPESEDAEEEELGRIKEDRVEPLNPQNMIHIGRSEEGEAEPPNPHMNRMKYYATCF